MKLSLSFSFLRSTEDAATKEKAEDTNNAKKTFETMLCTRVVFGVRAKLRSGFHFISGPPSTILLWSVMDFLPPSHYPLSLSPNVYYTQGVGRF